MGQRSFGKISIGTALAVALLVATPVAVIACSVPVFRYALERWKSDDYKVTVFHRGALSDEQQKLLTAFEASDRPKGGNSANVKLVTVDLADKPADEMLQLWKQQKSDVLPWIAVEYPQSLPPASAAALTRENVTRILDSPARREIARRVLKGETAVWIFLESGKREADDNAFKLLQKEIMLAGRNLKLPEIDKQDIEDKLVTIDPEDLKIAFSAIRVSRDDPAEKFLVDMLLGSEGAGEDGFRSPQFAGQPMAFPIFGRGRILYGLVGTGINEEMIGAACKELVGPCTCEVKEKNPGVDLLMSINWDELVQPTFDIDKELPPLTGLGTFTGDDKDLLATTADAKERESAPTAPGTNDKSPPAGSSTNSNRATAVKASTSTGAVAENPVTVTTPQPEPSGISAVTRNTLILIGLAVVGVIAASFVLVSRRG